MTASDPGTAGAPAAPASQPQAGIPPTQETPPAEAPQAGEPTSADERISLDEARKLRQEAHSLRQRLAAAEKKVTEHEDAKLSEQDRLQKRAAELEQQLGETRTRYQERLDAAEIRIAAQQLGFADPGDAARLLDRDALSRDDDGVLAGVPAALKKLAEAKPYLLSGPASGSTTGRLPIPGTPRPAGPPSSAETLEHHKQQLRSTGRYAM